MAVKDARNFPYHANKTTMDVRRFGQTFVNTILVSF